MDGTAAREDLFYHINIAFNTLFTFYTMSFGGWAFTWYFFGFDDGFTCDLQQDVVTLQNTYSQLPIIRSSMTSREDCYTKMPSMFNIVDLNKDGYISKCEDATLQYAFGATKEYAFKFAG